MKEENRGGEHNFYCVISNGNLYLDCVYKPARTKRSEGWLSYFFSLNTINARVVFVAQLLERRYWEVSGSILDRVTNIQIFLLAAIAQWLDVEGLKPIKKL